jgi:SAM-dependent methyltransferase
VINQLQKAMFRPARGWDPVPGDHAASYAKCAWRDLDERLVDFIGGKIGGLQGKRVLDLGGGPGQYSVALARRGATVLWHDISSNYLGIARRRAEEHRVRIEFSLGYLEDAKRFAQTPFDLVFCRLSWRYCVSEDPFAGLIYSLVREGGAAYIESEVRTWAELSGLQRFQYLLNKGCWLKLGHPFPPRGRIAQLFQGYPIEHMCLDYRLPQVDRVFFIKPGR